MHDVSLVSSVYSSGHVNTHAESAHQHQVIGSVPAGGGAAISPSERQDRRGAAGPHAPDALLSPLSARVSGAPPAPDRRCRRALSQRHIRVRVAHQGRGSRERLGQHGWVVERSLAWFNRFRPLTVRYERRAAVHQAFPLPLGCALLCLHARQTGFCTAL